MSNPNSGAPPASPLPATLLGGASSAPANWPWGDGLSPPPEADADTGDQVAQAPAPEASTGDAASAAPQDGQGLADRVIDYFITQASKGAGEKIGHLRYLGDLDQTLNDQAKEAFGNQVGSAPAIRGGQDAARTAVFDALRKLPTEAEATAATQAMLADGFERLTGRRPQERNYNPIVDAIVGGVSTIGPGHGTARELAKEIGESAGWAALKQMLDYAVSPEQMQQRLTHPPMSVTIGQR